MYHALYNHSIWSWISGAFRAWNDSIQEALIPSESEETEDSGSVSRAESDGSHPGQKVSFVI